MRRRPHEAGAALLAVLVIFFAVTVSSSSFIWFMSQQQTRAGARYRAGSALAIAQAGVYWALAYLESNSRPLAPVAHAETAAGHVARGHMTVLMAPEPDGAFMITSTGTVAETSRRLRARAYVASPAVLAALFGRGVVRLENPPTTTLLLPYGAATREQPWVHIAAGQGVWFASTGVSINKPLPTIAVAPGPVDVGSGGTPPATPVAPGSLRFLFGKQAELLIDQDRQRADEQAMRALGVNVDRVARLPDALPQAPQVDREFYREKARANTANAHLNKTAGDFAGDRALAQKRDSLYSRSQIEQVQEYLRAWGRPFQLQGIVYLPEGLSLSEGQRLQILDGSLITESTMHVSRDASLEITHTAATRALPGLIVLDDGALILTLGGRLRVHGLVYVSRLFDVGDGSRVDFVGSVVANDPEISFRNAGASVVIRYDPAVLGTPGLRVHDGTVVAWVASWEELP